MDRRRKGWEMSGGKTVLEFRFLPQTWLISALASHIPNERTTVDEPGGARLKEGMGGLSDYIRFPCCSGIPVFSSRFHYFGSATVQGIPTTPTRKFSFISSTPLPVNGFTPSSVFRFGPFPFLVIALAFGVRFGGVDGDGRGGFLYLFARVGLFALYCINHFIDFIAVNIYFFDITCVKQK